MNDSIVSPLRFEMIFDGHSYPGMVSLKYGDIRPTVWRSLDLGQTYRVAIIDDPYRELTVVTITKPKAATISRDEGKDVLDKFYPYRKAERLDSSGQGNYLKYAVWPTDADLQLPWYSCQLMAIQNEQPDDRRR